LASCGDWEMEMEAELEERRKSSVFRKCEFES
jgi:hypothetical protein